MKNYKNTFILLVIAIMCLIIGSQVFSAYSKANKDTNSYVELVSGQASKNDMPLQQEKDYILMPGDVITTKMDSLAVISWGDGSITRLGENTKIKVEQNQVSKDYTDIKISFDLLAGKSWSQVVSFIGKDSSFTQKFNGVEAGVRGTVFSVDLENEYIKVEDHAVALISPQGEDIYIREGEILNIQDFSLIELSRFIRDLEDRAWEDINKKLDVQTLSKLQEKLKEKISTGYSFLFLLDFISPKYRIIHTLNTGDNYNEIEQLLSKVSENDSQEVYNEILSNYQDFHTVQVKNYEFYKRKIWYKKALLYFDSEGETAESLLRSASYDIDDMTKDKQFSGFADTIEFISDYEGIITDIDLSVIKNSLQYLPDSLLEEFKDQFGGIQSIFQGNIPTGLNPNSILDSADSTVKQFLDENVGGFIQNIR